MDRACQSVSRYFARVMNSPSNVGQLGSKAYDRCFDLEVEQREQTSSMWHLKYRLVGKDNEFISIADPARDHAGTGRSINPKMSYQHVIGKMVILPLSNRHIPFLPMIMQKWTKGLAR